MPSRNYLLALIAAFAWPAATGQLLAAPPDGASPADATRQVYETTVRPFLAQHCLGCHGPQDRKAGLRLDDLGYDFLEGKTADVWKEAIDRINLGEMPPQEKPRPDAQQSFAVVEWVGRELKRAEREARMAGGRILSRRLNRSEYANTIRDLLHLDANFTRLIEEELPGDGKAEGFDRIGAALLFDETQLASYIQQAGVIANKAIVDIDAAPRPLTTRREFETQWRKPRDSEEVIQYQKDTAIPPGPTPDLLRDGGVEFYNINSSNYTDGFGGFGSLYSFNLLSDSAVPADGYYRIRLQAGGFAGKRGTPIQVELVYLPGTPAEQRIRLTVRGTLAEPQLVETTVFLQQPAEGASPRVQLNWNGLNDVIIQTPELSKLNSRRISANGQIARLLAARAPQAEIVAAKAQSEALIAEARAFAQQPGATARIHNEKYQLDEVPRIFVDWIEFSGPIEPHWPPRSHQALFPQGLPTDTAAIRAAFARFLPRAYRRPATVDEVEHAVQVVERGKSQFGMSTLDALRYGLQTVLSSPDFLLLFEPSAAESATPAARRTLNDYELASRLSYFLWSTMPDQKLWNLAAANQLHQPAELQRQVQRMTADPQSREFVENFAGQWLHVRKFGTVMPARDYQDYDAALAAAEREEPYAFFEEVLRQDLSILNFLESDFALVNARLARFYGIAGVEGDHFRRVALRPEHRRGGVLTMGGLLTLLADGTRTLPVRRGAWILEEIFNHPPPPPPPNAGEIQPNAAGQRLTVRQRLERHRTDATCASCHAKIDPLGLALENYDAIGAWRDVQNGEGFRGNRSPPIDASGTLPSGRQFHSPAEFKQALLEEKDRFARALAEKMLTYALGRPVGYVDHAALTRCTEALAQDEYRIQSLLTAIVTSEPFLNK